MDPSVHWCYRRLISLHFEYRLKIFLGSTICPVSSYILLSVIFLSCEYTQIFCLYPCFRIIFPSDQEQSFVWATFMFEDFFNRIPPILYLVALECRWRSLVRCPLVILIHATTTRIHVWACTFSSIVVAISSNFCSSPLILDYFLLCIFDSILESNWRINKSLKSVSMNAVS